MFNGCQYLEYIYLDIKNPISLINDIFLLTHSNLIFCGEISEDISLDLILFSNKIYCNNNKNINNKYMFYMKNFSLYNNTCYLCGEEFVI